MTGGDPGTYGTTWRVTSLTDGTRHSIRMANRGIALEAGVILRGQVVVGLAFEIPKRGSVVQVEWPRGPWERCKAVVFQAAVRLSYERVSSETRFVHPRDTRWCCVTRSGFESTDRSSPVLMMVLGTTWEWTRWCRAQAIGCFALNWKWVEPSCDLAAT